MPFPIDSVWPYWHRGGLAAATGCAGQEPQGLATGSRISKPRRSHRNFGNVPMLISHAILRYQCMGLFLNLVIAETRGLLTGLRTVPTWPDPTPSSYPFSSRRTGLTDCLSIYIDYTNNHYLRKQQPHFLLASAPHLAGKPRTILLLLLFPSLTKLHQGTSGSPPRPTPGPEALHQNYVARCLGARPYDSLVPGKPGLGQLASSLVTRSLADRLLPWLVDMMAFLQRLSRDEACGEELRGFMDRRRCSVVLIVATGRNSSRVSLDPQKGPC